MEAHLGSCPECRAVLNTYGRIGESLRELPGTPQSRETLEAAQERVWKKLTAPGTSTASWQDRGSLPHDAWIKGPGFPLRYRSVTLPLPVAAAAILLIIASFALIGIRGLRGAPSQNAVAAATLELGDQGILPIQDITEVLQYLSSQDNGDFMVIRLPESRKFSRIGEPALINAADYSRRAIIR